MCNGPCWGQRAGPLHMDQGRELLPGTETLSQCRGLCCAYEGGIGVHHSLWQTSATIVPALLSHSMLGGSFCIDATWQGNGWTPPIAFLHSTRQLKTFSPSSEVKDKMMKSSVFYAWNPFCLLLRFPQTAWSKLFVQSLLSCSKSLAGWREWPSQAGSQQNGLDSAGALAYHWEDIPGPLAGRKLMHSLR